MTFTRGQDPKEVLKVGRKANAIKIGGFLLHVRANAPFLPDLSKEDIIKYSIISSKTASRPLGVRILEPHLIEDVLTILERDGICKDMHEYLEHFASMYILSKRPEIFPSHAPIERDFSSWDVSIRGVSLVLEADNDPSMGNTIHLNFNMTGQDILYRNRLCRIAEPKDGY